MNRIYVLLAIVILAAPVAAQDMPLSQILIDGEGWKIVSGEFPLIPSLAADRHGNVYVADPERKQIQRIDREGKRSVFVKTSAGVHGLCCGPDGRLYACQPSRHRIIALSLPAEGDATSVEEKVVLERLAAHDLIVTTTKRIYCTVPGELAVYLIEPEGKTRKLESTVVPPGGLTLWPDEGTLVVSYPASKNLFAYRVEKSGALSDRDRYYALRVSGGHTSARATQLTEDVDRRLYAATREGVQVYDPTGRMSGVLLKPERADVTAVTIGGPGHSTLFIACGNKVYARKIKARGAFPLEMKK